MEFIIEEEDKQEEYVSRREVLELLDIFTNAGFQDINGRYIGKTISIDVIKAVEALSAWTKN